MGESPSNSSLDERLADQADLAGVAHVVVGEGDPVGQVVPVADVEEGGRGAVDEQRHPVAVAVDDLRAGADDGRGVADVRAVAEDGVAVLRA